MSLAFYSPQGEPVLRLSGAAGGRTPITRLDKYWSRSLYRPLAIHLSSQDRVGFITKAWLQTQCQIPFLFVRTMLRALGSVLDGCTYLIQRWPAHTYCASKRLYPGNWQAPLQIKNDLLAQKGRSSILLGVSARWCTPMTGGVKIWQKGC